MSNKLKESFKEGARIVVLGVVSYLLAGGIDAVLNRFGANMDTGTRLIVSGAITTVLRSVDKYIHESGKYIEKKTGKDSKLTKGLTQF